jgi:hypothetical protein
VHPVGDLVQSLGEVSDGESLAEMSAPFIPLPVAVTSGVLVISVSSAGALAHNSSSEMSLRYRSGRFPEGLGVSPAAMKTWRSGVPRPESVVTTSVDICSSVGARGVPLWKGSESR